MGAILRQSGFKDPRPPFGSLVRLCALKAVAKVEIWGFIYLFLKATLHPYWGIYLQFHRTGGVPEVLSPCQTFREGDSVGRDLVSPPTPFLRI